MFHERKQADGEEIEKLGERVLPKDVEDLTIRLEGLQVDTHRKGRVQALREPLRHSHRLRNLIELRIRVEHLKLKSVSQPTGNTDSKNILNSREAQIPFILKSNSHLAQLCQRRYEISPFVRILKSLQCLVDRRDVGLERTDFKYRK